MNFRTGFIAIALAFPVLSAHAAALSRTDQNVDYLFESGNNVNVGVGVVTPSVKGNDTFIQQPTGSVGEDFNQVGLSVKGQINERVAVALGYDQPFGIDVKYNALPGNPIPTSGMEAHAKVHALTALVKYELPNNVSVYGGPAYYQTKANVKLPYGKYEVNMPSDGAWGYVAGVAYEKPEIALRGALTYRSSAKYDHQVTESFVHPLYGVAVSAPSDLTFKLPQSVNLDFQTGIMPKTLLITGARWVNWKQFNLSPKYYGDTMVSFPKDSWEFKLGVGRQLTDKLSGQVVLGYDTGNGQPVSPLGPPDKGYNIAVAAKYAINKNVDIGAGIQYNWYKDQTVAIEKGGKAMPVAQFKDMNVFGAGLHLGVHF